VESGEPSAVCGSHERRAAVATLDVSVQVHWSTASHSTSDKLSVQRQILRRGDVPAKT